MSPTIGGQGQPCRSPAPSISTRRGLDPQSIWALGLLALGACQSSPEAAVRGPSPNAAPDTTAAIPPSTESPEPSPARSLDGFSAETQTVGEVTDGVTLSTLRHARHEAMYRFVFEFDGDLVPHTKARSSPSGNGIEVVLSGVRWDKTGHRPLVGEDGTPFGSKVIVESEPISSFGRQQVLDDSSVAYRIELTSQGRFRLHTLPDPPRVILDIAAAHR